MLNIIKSFSTKKLQETTDKTLVPKLPLPAGAQPES